MEGGVLARNNVGAYGMGVGTATPPVQQAHLVKAEYPEGTLFNAVARGKLAEVQALVKAASDTNPAAVVLAEKEPSSSNYLGMTPLHVACENGHEKVVQVRGAARRCAEIP